MIMGEWASKLDVFLQFNGAEILRDKWKVAAVIAKAFVESKFEKVSCYSEQKLSA